jgi:hypothetical protein
VLADQVPFENISSSPFKCPPESWYVPTAVQSDAAGHETEVRSGGLALLFAVTPVGRGADIALQVVPERVATSGMYTPPVLRYWPTATHDVVDVHVTEYSSALGNTGPASVAASPGSGARAADQLPLDIVSTNGCLYPDAPPESL